MNKGPHVTRQGDVISAALSTESRSADRLLFDDNRLMLGQIQVIYPIDDTQNNAPNKSYFTVYDVQVFHPDGSTEILKRCRAIQPLFGGTYNNFFEVLPTNPGPTATDYNVGRAFKPGTWVLVALIDGQRSNGVIMGSMPHPNPIAVGARPTQDKGVYLEGEFQGFNFKITNEGALEITFNGPKDLSGSLINSNGPTTFTIDSQGNISMATNNSQSVSVNRVTGIVDVVNGPTEIKMDQNANQITAKAATVLVECAQASIQASGSAKCNSAGDMTVSSGSAIKLQRGADGSPSEPFVLGQVFVSFMSSFLQAIMSHTHVGNLGFPTSPPNNNGDFATLASSPIGDKSILSNLIIGDK